MSEDTWMSEVGDTTTWSEEKDSRAAKEHELMAIMDGWWWYSWAYNFSAKIILYILRLMNTNPVNVTAQLISFSLDLHRNKIIQGKACNRALWWLSFVVRAISLVFLYPCWVLWQRKIMFNSVRLAWDAGLAYERGIHLHLWPSFSCSHTAGVYIM